MDKNIIDREEAHKHLKDVKSLLEEKKSFKDTEEYKEAQKIVNEVTKIEDIESKEEYIDVYPQRAIIKLEKAKKILRELG